MDEPLGHDPGSIDDELSDDLRARVKSELEPGERLLWSARPILRHEPLSRGFLAGVLIAIVLSVFGGACLLKLIRDPLQEIKGVMPLGLMMGLLAVLIILGLVLTQHSKWSERTRLAGTLYALTDRRAIIWYPVRPSGAFRVVTIPRGSVSKVHRIEYPDGSGDIVFKDRLVVEYGEELQIHSGFYQVADVRRVEEQVRRTLIESPIPPTTI